MALGKVKQGLYGVIAEFTDPQALLTAANATREAGYTSVDAFSPFPIHGLAEAIGFTKSKLSTIGTEQFSSPAAVTTTGPTLKQLLAGDEARHTLLVEEDGGRTTVTLLSPDLFASGSDRLNDSATAVVARVAEAIRRLPGPVLVVGHTDDQPIHSIRFSDNFALSRARAERVAALLRARVDAAGRVQVNGVGSTRPRYRPENTPENRARNRRVEIVHVATS
jgi:type VI secretion system protein ImpK